MSQKQTLEGIVETIEKHNTLKDGLALMGVSTFFVTWGAVGGFLFKEPIPVLELSFAIGAGCVAGYTKRHKLPSLVLASTLLPDLAFALNTGDYKEATKWALGITAMAGIHYLACHYFAKNDKSGY